MIPNDKHSDALKATHADMVKHAREHYEFVSQLARGYSTSIPHAIDAWEREPDLLAALEAAEARASYWEMQWTGATDNVEIYAERASKLAEQLAGEKSRAAAAEARAGRLVSIVDQAIKWFGMVSSSDGSGHGDLALRLTEQKTRALKGTD